MDKITAQSIKAIINELKQHPAMSIFYEPVDPVHDEAPNYNEIIRYPMCLRIIEERLNSGSYSSICEWKEDMLLIFSNAVQYNGKKSLIGAIATHLYQIYRELSKPLDENPNQTWYNTLVELKQQIIAHINTKTLTQIPKSPSKFSMSNSNQNLQSPEICQNTLEVHRLSVNSFSKSELEKLEGMLTKLTAPRQISNMISIIENICPEFMPKSRMINLSLLPPECLMCLREYAYHELSIE